MEKCDKDNYFSCKGQTCHALTNVNQFVVPFEGRVKGRWGFDCCSGVPLVPTTKSKCYEIAKIKQDFRLKMIKYRKVFLDVQYSVLVYPYLAKTATSQLRQFRKNIFNYIAAMKKPNGIACRQNYANA